MAKCSECGFLTFRNFESGALVEVDAEVRDTARLEYGGSHGRLNRYPLCFAREFDLAKEFQSALENVPDRELDQDSRQVVIQSNRDCDENTEWQQGFTPKEHREMLDRERLLDREDRRDREVREWQKNLARQNTWFNIAGMIGAAILGTAAGATITLLAQALN